MSGFAHEIGALQRLPARVLHSLRHLRGCLSLLYRDRGSSVHADLEGGTVQASLQARIQPFAPLYRLFGFKREVTADQLAQWQHLLFDSCNMCGRCSLICPMGIDVAALIEQARHAMFDAGLAPQELYQKAAHQHLTGQPEASAEPYRDQLLAIGRFRRRDPSR
jgi:ferredoxin